MSVAVELIVRISTNESRSCPLCNNVSLDGEWFERSAEHLFKHGLQCLHVGQETGTDDQGRPFQMTVAVFGR